LQIGDQLFGSLSVEPKSL